MCGIEGISAPGSLLHAEISLLMMSISLLAAVVSAEIAASPIDVIDPPEPKIFLIAAQASSNGLVNRALTPDQAFLRVSVGSQPNTFLIADSTESSAGLIF